MRFLVLVVLLLNYLDFGRLVLILGLVLQSSWKALILVRNDGRVFQGLGLHWESLFRLSFLRDTPSRVLSGCTITIPSWKEWDSWASSGGVHRFNFTFTFIPSLVCVDCGTVSIYMLVATNGSVLNLGLREMLIDFSVLFGSMSWRLLVFMVWNSLLKVTQWTVLSSNRHSINLKIISLLRLTSLFDILVVIKTSTGIVNPF